MLSGDYWSIAASLAEHPGSSSITPAVDWVQGTLLGSIALAIAVIAIASVGLLMLNGRIDLRRGMVVIAGCFILFGAPAIANGIQSMLRGGYEGAEAAAEAPPPAPAPPVLPPGPANADPYAGASVPAR